MVSFGQLDLWYRWLCFQWNRCIWFKRALGWLFQRSQYPLVLLCNVFLVHYNICFFESVTEKNSKQISPSGTLKDSNLIQDAINHILIPLTHSTSIFVSLPPLTRHLLFCLIFNLQISSTNQAGEVVLAPGDYGLVSGISIPSNVVLRGSGSYLFSFLSSLPLFLFLFCFFVPLFFRPVF